MNFNRIDFTGVLLADARWVTTDKGGFMGFTLGEYGCERDKDGNFVNQQILECTQNYSSGKGLDE